MHASKFVIQILANNILFESLTPEEIKMSAANAKLIQLTSGQRLFSEGDDCEGLYVIIEGGVNLLKGENELFITVVGAGGFVGENSLFKDNVTQSVSAVAADHTQCIFFSKSSWRTFLDANPDISLRIYRTFIVDLIDRLEHTSRELSVFGSDFEKDQGDISALFD